MALPEFAIFQTLSAVWRRARGRFSGAVHYLLIREVRLLLIDRLKARAESEWLAVEQKRIDLIQKAGKIKDPGLREHVIRRLLGEHAPEIEALRSEISDGAQRLH
jgi:hypothetical protein